MAGDQRQPQIHRGNRGNHYSIVQPPPGAGLLTPAREVILASTSKVRSQILESAGVLHSRDPAELDEREQKDWMAKQGADVETVAASLARAKAREVRKRHAHALVIGADQILECEGKWFDKPQDRDSAAKTLRTLRGRTHRLISAVAAYEGEECVWWHLETASLTMREFSDAFLERYIDDASPGILEVAAAWVFTARGRTRGIGQ